MVDATVCAAVAALTPRRVRSLVGASTSIGFQSTAAAAELVACSPLQQEQGGATGADVDERLWRVAEAKAVALAASSQDDVYLRVHKPAGIEGLALLAQLPAAACKPAQWVEACCWRARVAGDARQL